MAVKYSILEMYLSLTFTQTQSMFLKSFFKPFNTDVATAFFQQRAGLSKNNSTPNKEGEKSRFRLCSKIGSWKDNMVK